MKKALVILLALCTIGAAFAADVATATLSGSVSATWGYNLQEEASGFKNDSDVVVSFPLAAFGDKAQGGEGMYGEIIVKDFGLKIDNDTTLGSELDADLDDGEDPYAETNGLVEGGDYDVSGIIHFNKSAWLGVYSYPDFDTNYAKNYDSDDGNTVQDIHLDNKWTGGNAGVEFGYGTDMFSIALQAVSLFDYDKGDETAYTASAAKPYEITNDENFDGADTKINTDNLYIYSAKIGLKPIEGLSVDARFTMIPEDFVTYTLASALNVVNAKVAYTVGALTASFGTDLVLMAEEGAFGGDTTMLYDLSPVLSYKVVDGFTANAKVWMAGSDTDADVDAPLNVEFGLVEDLATGIVPNLGFTLTVALDDLLGDQPDADTDESEWYVDATVSYLLVEGLTAKADVGYGIDEKLTAGASLEMGAAFTGIANTTFTVTYDDFASVTGGNDKGVVTVAAKIAF